MAVSISISITQNSQNITNNKSNATVKVTASWTGGSYNKVVDASGKPQANGSVKIDGTSYSFNSTFNDNRTMTGSKVIFTKTLDISHGADGKKTLICSASFKTYLSSSGTPTATASKVLTTIPRKSSLSVSNGTLGETVTLTVTRQSTDFTHTVTYKCGTASGTLCTKSKEESLWFIPLLGLASQNTTGTSVTITYTIKTYNGDTLIGSTDYTKTCAIPSSVVPSCSIAAEDDIGYRVTYGGYIRGLSKVKGTIIASGVYGSTIKSYSTTVDGKTYTGDSFTSNVLTTSGTLTLTTTVTDSRGRKATAKTTITVLDYVKPTITALTVTRCDASGNKSSSGAYLKAVFSSKVTALNNKNKATYKIKYKKTTESTYTESTLTNYANNYTVTNGYVIFAASAGNTFNVLLEVTDNFDSFQKVGTGKSAFKFFSFLTKGTGMAIGKIAELANVLDIGFQTRFSGGTMAVVAEKVSDIDDLKTPNTYITVNNASSTYANCPDGFFGTFTIEVLNAGQEGQLMQRATLCSKEYPDVRVRHYYYNEWGEWHREGGITNIITAHLSADTNTVADAYTKISLVQECKIGNGLTVSDGAIKVGAGVKAVRINASVVFKINGAGGNKHIRIKKGSGDTYVAWATDSGTSGKTQAMTITPKVINVSNGDLLSLYYYSGAANDVINAGSSGGYVTFLTVEAVA